MNRKGGAPGYLSGGFVVFTIVVLGLAFGFFIADDPEPAAVEYSLAPPPTGEDAVVDWQQVIRDRVPPLSRPLGRVRPLVLWHDGLKEAADREAAARMLLDRGITPHVRLEPASIPAAQAVSRAGAPVVILEGKSGNWPYDLAEDWGHRFPDDADIPDEWQDQPQPLLFTGWATAADHVRKTLMAFKAAGVDVAAVWLDYENQPMRASRKALLAAPDSLAMVPRGAVSGPREFAIFRRQLWMELLSAYIAAPVREIFPAASVTNWTAMVSLPANPVIWWFGEAMPLQGATLFTASNPIAYGVDLAFLSRFDPKKPVTRKGVDDFYAHVLLQQVSLDAENRAKAAPHLQSVPWVARWVRVEEKHPRPTPIMGRERYREILRHLWLRGISGMQIFNSPTTSDLTSAIAEVEDAVGVLDEMLEFREFLEEGRPVNFDHPGPEGGVLWSGLALGDRALIRIHAPDGARGGIVVEPWPGLKARLPLKPGGHSYVVERSPT